MTLTMTMLRHVRWLAAGLLLAVTCSSLATAATLSDSRGREDKATRTLFEAVHTNDFAAAEAAVAAGANVDAKNRWNLTPVELAIDKGYFRIAHFLVSVRNNRHQTPAESAAERPVATPRNSARSDAQTHAQQPAAARRPANREPVPQAWPSNKPNPFDPMAPAFGAGLPVVESPQTFRLAPATGDLLATDTPAAAAAEYRN